MSILLHQWPTPNPHRARELVVASPYDVPREARVRQEMAELGIRRVGGSSLQTWEEALNTGQADGAAVTTNAADTTMLPTTGLYTLPANFFSIGKTLRIKAAGRVSNIVTTPGTLTLKVFFGGSIVAFNGGAMQLNAVAKTNVTWFLDLILTCRAIGTGTSTTLMGIGQWTSESVVGAGTGGAGSTGNGTFNIPASAPAVGAGFDSSLSQLVDLRANFSLTGNSLTCHLYVLEALN